MYVHMYVYIYVHKFTRAYCLVCLGRCRFTGFGLGERSWSKLWTANLILGGLSFVSEPWPKLPRADWLKHSKAFKGLLQRGLRFLSSGYKAGLELILKDGSLGTPFYTTPLPSRQDIGAPDMKPFPFKAGSKLFWPIS